MASHSLIIRNSRNDLQQRMNDFQFRIIGKIFLILPQILFTFVRSFQPADMNKPVTENVEEMTDILIAMLWSISPFGEAKVGIPYAIFNEVNYYIAFVTCLAANILVFPVMQFFLNFLNRHFLRWRFYKRSAIFVARRAKSGAGAKVQKYGFWGLIGFVMLPIPGTGVYAGTIAAYLFGIRKRTAFAANTIGIFLSCVLVWAMTVGSLEGFN